MTRELAGHAPTPLEALLVDRIVVCWMHLHYAETIYVQNMQDYSLTQAAFHQHRITTAHNRYLSAIRALAQVRRLQVPTVQVNIAREQLNVAAIAERRAGTRSHVRASSLVPCREGGSAQLPLPWFQTGPPSTRIY